jgi:tripartite-type tricarboxylate transporter receptor subunit TctC
MQRLGWLGAVALVVGTLAGGQALAQSKALKIIVPYTPGSGPDILSRLLSEQIGKANGPTVVVENRPGGGAMIGIDAAARSEPDGNTLLLAANAFVVNAAMKRNNMSLSSFEPVCYLASAPMPLVVQSSAPWKTAKELVADAKANPGKINYGTPGAGTSLHVTMEQIAKQHGIQWTHIPFKGNAEATNALLGGHIHAEADSTGWASLVDAGQLRLLVTWGASRTVKWPSVPTLRDIGIDMVSNSPFGIAGPKDMDPQVVKILHDAFKKGMAERFYIEVLERLDQEPFYLNSADYQAFATRQMAEQKQLVEDLGLKQY